MGIIEIIFAIAIAATTGYHAGQAGQKTESLEQGKICFDQDYNERKAGCYRVSKTPFRDGRSPAGTK